MGRGFRPHPSSHAFVNLQLPAGTTLSLKVETGPLPAGPGPVPRRTPCPGCGTRDRVSTFTVTVVLEVTMVSCGRSVTRRTRRRSAGRRRRPPTAHPPRGGHAPGALRGRGEPRGYGQLHSGIPAPGGLAGHAPAQHRQRQGREAVPEPGRGHPQARAHRCSSRWERGGAGGPEEKGKAV
jgi:hypothetical protein